MAKRAKSEKGTWYTQTGDYTWDWENNEAGRSGHGSLQFDPNTGKYSGTYWVNGGSTTAPTERTLGEDALMNHVWNLKNLEFKEEEPLTWQRFWKDFKWGAKDWARERGWIKKRGGRLMRVGGKIVEVPRTLK